MLLPRLLGGMLLSRLLRLMPSSARKPVIPFFEFTLTHRGSAKYMTEPGVGLQPNVACEFETGRLSLMAVRGQCSLRKLERASPAACDLRPATCDLRLATCDLRLAAFSESPAFLRSKFAACEVFECCIILPIQGKASRLIRSAGRFRKESMRRRISRFAFPKLESRSREISLDQGKMSSNKHRKEPALRKPRWAATNTEEGLRRKGQRNECST